MKTKKTLDKRLEGGPQEVERKRLAGEDKVGGGLCGMPRSMLDCSLRLNECFVSR